jgi:hypothetical protein
MMATSIQGKIIEMEDKAIDYQAEEELIKLEEKLGMREPAKAEEEQTQEVAIGGEAPPAGETTEAPESPASEVEKQLEELEKRVNPGS